MATLTKTVDGKALPPDKFAYVGDAADVSTWHLPIDSDHIGSAVKMFGHEQNVPSDKKAAVARKIASTAKAAGIDTSNFEKQHCGVECADFGNGWVEIFKAGDYGDKGKFDEADLDRIAAGYDPAVHEAPACIGHPEHDAPAFGWVDRLKRSGSTLLAKFREVDPGFESLVKAGRFKKRSAAFYLDGAGKVAGLRHVGFLGAMPPEVKGLANLKFDDAGRRITEVDFGEETVAQETKTVKEQIAEFFAEMFGNKRGEPKTFSEADVQRIATEAATAASKPLVTQVTALETELAAQKTRFSERETQIVTTEHKQRAIEAVNRLKGKGAWVPAFEKMGLPLLFEELAKSPATIEFGEEGKKKRVSQLELLATFLEGFGRIVPAGRTFAPGGAVPAQKGTGDPLTDMARARQKEKKITFSEALSQIAEEQPELATTGGFRAGQV